MTQPDSGAEAPPDSPDEALDDLTARLQAIKAERGYLLPHHGLMAVSAPDMLQAYATTYRAMTLTDRVLTPFEKEFIWLAILIATDENEATHHIAKFYRAGGTNAQVGAVARLVAQIRGAAAFRFVGAFWQSHMPWWDGRAEQRAARDAIARDYGIEPWLLTLADAASRVCLDQHEALAWAIEDAYAQASGEDRIAETLMLTMFPASVPRYVRAAEVWLKLIRDGRVAASAPYQAWASLTGQGGFDEASGKANGHS